MAGVAVSAAVSSNYLTLTARHLIQTLPALEKDELKHGENEGREREEREAGGKKGKKGLAWVFFGEAQGLGKRENSIPCISP